MFDTQLSNSNMPRLIAESELVVCDICHETLWIDEDLSQHMEQEHGIVYKTDASRERVIQTTDGEILSKSVLDKGYKGDAPTFVINRVIELSDSVGTNIVIDDDRFDINSFYCEICKKKIFVEDKSSVVFERRRHMLAHEDKSGEQLQVEDVVDFSVDRYSYRVFSTRFFVQSVKKNLF